MLSNQHCIGALYTNSEFENKWVFHSSNLTLNGFFTTIIMFLKSFTYFETNMDKCMKNLIDKLPGTNKTN